MGPVQCLTVTTSRSNKSKRARAGICTWGALKERRRCRAEKRLSKRVFLESPFSLCPLKVFRCFESKPTGGREETESPQTSFWTTVSPHDTFAAPWALSGCMTACHRGPKRHINFFNINFLAPTQNTPFWTPRKMFMCLISRERTQKGTHINFFGGTLGVKRGSQTGRFRPQKV